MSNTFNTRTGFVAEDELVQMSAQEQSAEAGGTTTVPCGVIGLTIAASAALPDFCPTGACTTRC